MRNRIAIIAAPNGARKQKSDHPALPVTVDEIVNDVLDCRDAGAAMVHVHARDKNGNHSLAVDDNQVLFNELKDRVGDSVIIQLTTEAIGIYSPEQQMELIREICPPAASFALKELVPDEKYLVKAEQFFHWVADQNILAQYILYDREDVDRYLSLCRDGVLPVRGRHALLVLGRYQKDQFSEPSDLIPFLSRELLDNERWGVCAFGPKEHQCLTAAMLLGGDIRVGFENNHLDKFGNPAKNNATQITNLSEQARMLNIELDDAISYQNYFRTGG
ncbi:3-keto-5-aminohexanoate cleavage protein [Vibrio hannami]|uniref:3-keto-5-aminohexanoate cleavage protein n=1 Tax=Vibrio hannami TaxID=2717094 RepID=UPI00240EBFEF|nr:3-keto-5-aminohexanoate cleavage protein [Vibrio hannami]MDG3084944.1 3-keto-5-aminohexanoate cleavage protein [Vibrio hannami]